jgi:hypothetical protein
MSFNINIHLDVCFHSDLLISFDRAYSSSTTFMVALSSYHSSVVKVLVHVLATKNRCPGILTLYIGRCVFTTLVLPFLVVVIRVRCRSPTLFACEVRILHQAARFVKGSFP